MRFPSWIFTPSSVPNTSYLLGVHDISFGKFCYWIHGYLSLSSNGKKLVVCRKTNTTNGNTQSTLFKFVISCHCIPCESQLFTLETGQHSKELLEKLHNRGQDRTFTEWWASPFCYVQYHDDRTLYWQAKLIVNYTHRQAHTYTHTNCTNDTAWCEIQFLYVFPHWNAVRIGVCWLPQTLDLTLDLAQQGQLCLIYSSLDVPKTTTSHKLTHSKNIHISSNKFTVTWQLTSVVM